MLDLPFLCWQPLTADSFSDLLLRDLFFSSHHLGSGVQVHFKNGFARFPLSCKNPQVALFGCFLNGLVFISLLVRPSLNFKRFCVFLMVSVFFPWHSTAAELSLVMIA